MEIILLERVEKLGQMGDVVKVKDGFARNFLLPQKKALRATDTNKAVFETQRKELEARNLEQKTEAEALAGKMADVKVVLIRQAGDSGQLYGSVTTRDIAASATEAGFAVDRAQVKLTHPIKTLGLFDVTIRLHAEVSETIVVNVARSDEEAQTQFETGNAIVGQQDDDEIEFESTFEADDEDDVVKAATEDAGEEATEEVAEDAAEEDTKDA